MNFAFFRKNELIWPLIILAVFLALRLPGVHLPLHQDEYKWPMIVNPAAQSDTEIPHPPLSQFIYKTAGLIVGFNTNFRFVPLFFGAVNLLLLFYFVRTNFGKKPAIISALIWTFSYFSILASLMVDTDGQMIPFFFLLSLISYYKLKNDYRNFKWWTVLILSFIGGFFIKVSFVLQIGAIIFDFILNKRKVFTKKQYVKFFTILAATFAFLVFSLYLSQKIFPFFNFGKSLLYWEHFFTFNRGWFQTFIQFVKVLLYLSPFLVLVPFLSSREIINKSKVFIIFIIFSLLFYLVIFDFSLGALDRYLQLLILPLTIIVSLILSEISFKEEKDKKYLLTGIILSLLLSLTLFVNHFVPSLHPKSEWISRILSLHWNFLYPFSGGSGPLGFYVSFLFMALLWILSLISVVFCIIKPRFKKMILITIIPIGLVYNFVFAEEYLFGEIYGSAPRLLTNVVEFIKNDPDIKYVTVYNDNGGAEIQAIGKYRKRLYTDPKFDVNEKIATLNKYKEYYLEIDIPRIDPNSVYRRYLDSCNLVYNQKDKEISAKVYDCRNAPDIKN